MYLVAGDTFTPLLAMINFCIYYLLLVGIDIGADLWIQFSKRKKTNK